MKSSTKLVSAAAVAMLLLVGAASCRTTKAHRVWPVTPPLGGTVDRILQRQEENAKATQLTVYMHEFELNRLAEDGKAHGYRLNSYGEDHVKQIAAMLRKGANCPVVVERSATSPKQGTQYQYPVHANDALDRQRREVVVRALQLLGVEDAEQRVVVGPAAAEGLDADEAAQAHSNSTDPMGSGAGFGFGFGFGGGF
jgi:hypothetical protein